MAEEACVVDVGGDEAQSEREPLVQREPPIYLHLRHGREPQRASKCMGFILTVFKVAFCSLGLWGHRAWNYIPRVVFGIICALQTAIYICVDFKCPYFDSSFHPKFNLMNDTLLNSNRHDLSESAATSSTLYSLPLTISYLVFIGCFFVSRHKDSALMSPSISMMEDVDKTEIYVLFLFFVIFVVSFSMATVFYFLTNYQVHTEASIATVILVILVILANWASLNACHVFAISSFTLGTLAQDTFRLIREVQNGTLDDVIRIHEGLCTVVLNTVSAYSVWFVLHWFTYGAGVVVYIILISKALFDNNQPPAEDVAYLCFKFVCDFYVFTLPCFCAARITSNCAGVYEKINCTTTEDWPAGHPFRDRHNIALFISYAKDRRCGFKVGRITFDTSLAWLSFFFGIMAFLSPFF